MNIVSFLSELRQRNISIRLNGDDLKVSGLKKDTSADIIDQLKQNKEELLSFLRRTGEAAWTGIPVAPAMETYPISHAQRQLWLIDQTTDVGATYNLFFKQEWNNVLDLDVLDGSMQFLLQRHEILRTVFPEIAGEVRQKILGMEESGFCIRKLAYDKSARDKVLLGLERSEAAHIFDLRTGPLLRVLVVSFGATEHVLLFTMHHIISDGWSKQVLFQELSAAYIDIKDGKMPSLPPLAIQYKDFACWQHLPATQRDLKKHGAYWLSVLGPERALMDLPADNRRPAVKTYLGSAVQLKISIGVLQQINELCQRCNCRIFSLLAAVHKTLLYRYTNEADIIVGMPVSGRIYPELQTQVGYYVNMVVLRTNMNAAHSFEQLVMQIEQNMHHAYEHQEYPFDKLLDDLSVRHDASRAPLFDLMMTYDKKSTLLFDQGAPDGAPMAVSKFDLEADFIEYSDGLLVGLTYNKALFSQERMDRMAQHFECLLLNALSNPGAALTSLEYISEEERSVLETFNYSDAWFPQDKTIIELFELQAASTPANPALAFENAVLSYQSFNETINSAAHYLRNVHGVKPGHKIGVMMERSERMVLAIYAIIKSGAAYVPIDPSYPLQRIQYMIQDSELKLLITNNAGELSCPVVAWDTINFNEYPVHDPAIVNTPEDPVYMIYTSGSTGNPKGVIVQHRSLTNFCQWASDLIYRPAGRALRVMLNGTISFDATVEILFPPLLNGSSLQVVPQNIKDDPYELLNRIIECGIEVVDLIPSYMHLLLQVAEANNIKPASLQYVTTGGELLQQETCDLFFSIMPGATIVNGYGPTEACVNTTCCMLDAGTGAKPNSIGVPLPNMRVHILDGQQREAGIGIWGELFIAGVGLATGYWKREALTNEKFILHPKFGRIYRSGDLARWNEKGEVEFLGRADNQVKIRGFRIETGEIESAIQSFTAVTEGVVIVSEHGTDKKLTAIICWRDGIEQVQQLRAHLTAVLPKYMVPEQFITAERIPRTGSGKLDRRALEQQGSKAAVNTSAYIGVQNKIEAQLLLVWQELLDLRRIDVNDNFFELGGHSLKAMRMVSRIYREFEVKISVKEIFQHDTIQKLARYIEQQQRTVVYQQIEPVSDSAFYPLSPGQRSLWLTVQMEAAQTAYNMVSGYQWLQALDENNYAKAWMLMLQRHEVLRTVFVLHEGAVWQQVKAAENMQDSLRFMDYTQLKPEDQQQQIQRVLLSAQQCRYDLTHGPLAQLNVLKLSDAHYEIILGIHHIISDAWSLDVMQQELLGIYNQLQNGSNATLQPLRIQYRDYAAWQNSRQMDEHREYWLSQLSGELVVPELPADRLRSARRSFDGSILLHQLDAAMLQSLQAVARQQQCSLYTVLVAAVNLLIFKYTGQKDIITGIPSAGREHEELEKQLGYYVNTLAIRNKIDADESAEQLLQNVKKNLLDAFAHQAYPFDKLVEELGVSNQQTRNPLFDVMVNYEQSDGSMELIETQERQAVSRFDLSIHFTRYRNGIVIGLTYNKQLFNGERIRGMAAHLEQVLQGICNNSYTAVKDIPVVTAEELLRIDAFNETAKDFGAPLCIPQLFEAQVLKTPDALAVQFAQAKLNYTELNERSNQLAHCLREQHDVSAGDRIGIMMDRSERMIIALMGILKAGAAYVPIDPTYPAERCRYMASDSGIKLLIADEGYGRWHQGNLLSWNEKAWQQYPVENPACIITPDNLAYIIYTSGSTGRPKGVMIKHGSLYNLCCWLKDLLYGQEQLVVMVTASVSFDASVKQLFPPLVWGSALHIISEDDRTNPVRYAKALLQGGTNVADMTPSFLQLLLQTIREHPAYSLHNLKYVLAGGETLQKETTRLFYELLPQAKLINVYGPTETCVDAAYKIMDTETEGYLTSIGKPLPNVQLHVMDEFLQPVPIGVFGELLIGGAGLAQGYCNQPELTAEKFIEHKQSRLYKTGDLARWNNNGEIEFYGRRDAQVKMRGYRIEIDEIENLITAHHLVKDAAVVYTNLQGNESLNAFVVWKDVPATAELHAYLQENLPAYMLPSSIKSLAQLPKAPGGKIDRKALAGMIRVTDQTHDNYTAPRNECESALVQIWEELLQQAPIGIDDDFWQRGGHSLKAMRMMVMVFAKLKVEVSIKDIFESRTIRKLAELISWQAVTEYVPITKVQNGQQAYPLSHAQKRLWIIHQLEEQLTAYNIVHTYTVPVNIVPATFSKAVQYLVDRHEILRTVFIELEGAAMQSVIDAADLTFEIKYPEQAQINEIVQQENNRVFNLQQGSLFTLAVVKTGINESTCVLNMHHIISDAWSISIFKRELQEAYQAYINNAAPAHQPLAWQYKDYAAWLNGKMDTGELAASRNYWKQHLAGDLPVLDLPSDLPRPVRKTYSGKQSNLVLPACTMQQIKQQSSQYGCSTFSYLYTCLNAFLHRYTHQQDIITGMPVAGRDRAELQDQLGFYVNVLPVRLQLQKEISFEQLLKQVQELLVQQLSHQLYPFDQLVEDLDIKKDLSRSPIFDVLVNHQRHDVPAGDLSFSLQTDGESSFSKYDLSFDFVEFTDAGLLSISYNTDIFLPHTAERMLLYFEELLNDALLNPGKQLHQLSFVPDAEQSMITEVFNDTTCPQPWSKTVVELLEQQAAQNPDAIAIETDNIAFTYRELNHLANQGAYFLRTVHSIQRGDRVGVVLERSDRMVLAIYSILKAGAAYVPIDPAYPLQRKLYMVQDSEVKFLITEKNYGDELGCPFTTWESVPIHEHATQEPVQNIPSDPAYMIYTSGSTGQPKGVLVQHAALTNLCQWYNEFIADISDNALKIYLNASINFDVSVGQMFGAMAAGCTLIVSPEEVKTDPHRLVAFLQKHKADLIDITPSFLQVLLLHIRASNAMCNLRFVLAAGEILTADTCKLFSQVFKSNAKLFNLYGPTEACVYTTVEEAKLVNEQYNTIGYPLLNAKLHVLDAHLQETGIGVWGELFISGAGLAAGYWKRDDLNKEKFILHPELGRVYRTGDVGRWNNSGSIEFRGRNDQQIKLRGFRVELGEVEQAIQSFAAVNETAVIYNEAEKQLIGFIVWKERQPEQLKHYLQQQLPAYMMPSRFMDMDEMPRSRSGKIDRVVLQQQAAQVQQHAMYRAATTKTEQVLLQSWKEILGVETIGVDDNFFELGGHSLKAMRMVSAIYRELGVKLSIRDVFMHATPFSLAKCIDGKSGSASTNIETVSPAEYYALSPGQRSIWFAAQQEGGSRAYNMVLRSSWSCRFDADAYTLAWKQLLARHEVLRTIFIVYQGQVWQKVNDLADAAAAIELDDLHGQNMQWQETALDILARQQQEHIFNLAEGPLVKTCVAQLADNNLEVFITIHHIIADAWSVNIIARDLKELYEAAVAGREPQLPELKIQYKDFAAWQNGVQQNEHKKYWNELFSGPLTMPELPADFARPAVKSYAGRTLTHLMDEQQLQALNIICREQQCSLFTVLTACMNLLLYRYTSQAEVVTGIPVAGREQTELQDGVGYYVNMLPLKTIITGKESFNELLALVKSNLLNAYEHQSYPVESLVQDVSARPAHGGNSLFNVVLNYDASEKAAGAAQGETDSVSKFDLSIHFTQYSDGLHVSFTYSTALFSRERMQRMLEHLVYIVSNTKNFLQQAVGAVQYFPTEELNLVTNAFNQTNISYDREKTISELVETQAMQQPNAVAVCCESRTITYAELNASANRVAHHLRNQFSILPGDRIGMVMDRSERMVIALLGILKSGAAYVPIDPAYPPSRCTYMQEDSGMKLLIAEKDYGAWSSTPVLNLEAKAWNNESFENPAQLHDANSLVYIIYTSGSTGQPKGVSVTHGSLHNLCAWHAHAFEVSADSSGTLYAGIGFDAAAWELWPYLVTGASVHAVNDALRFNLQSFANYLHDNSITHCFLPTPACEELIRNKISLPRNLCLLTGGDRLRVLPHAGMKLFNNYGPTESTVVATSMLMQEDATHVIPIGSPVGNTKIFILDKNMQAVPVGIYGEMYIAGESLAQGYHNKPELTAGRFIYHPITNERMFRTGDFARWLANGNIDFLGRMDDQVKVRGYRVEIAEVEQAMAKTEGVNIARVIADKTSSDTRLLGFYEGTITQAALQLSLQKQLPSYMCPAVCVQVEQFPLTPNGKIDDRALINLANAESAHTTGAEFLTQNEKLLSEIWQQVTGVPVPHRHASFFELGGHSLKAMQLIHLVEKQMGAGISLRDIYNNPSLVAMAALIGKERSKGLSIALNNAAADLPLMYMIPPVAGSATIYTSLAQKLSGTFRCTGLQYPGFDGDGEFSQSIEATAAAFYNEIMQQQHSTVYLLGYSLGALVAYETAKLLEAQGLAVKLILIDREPVHASAGHGKISKAMLAALAEHETTSWMPAMNNGIAERIKKLALQNLRNMQHYRQAGNISGNILAFSAAEGNQQMNGWKPFTSGSFGCHALPGNHYNMLSCEQLSEHLLEQ